MEIEDPSLNEFLDAVCNYMGSWYSCDDSSDNFSLDELCEEPHSEFKKLLKVLYRGLHPLHKEWFNDFFTPENIEWEYVHSLLSAHSRTLVLRYKKNIFIGLMYLCSFTYSLIDYCERKGLTERLTQAKLLIKQQFLKHMKDRFYFKGGWQALKIFCQRENLPILLELISKCYCEVALFHTHVKDSQQKVYNFGCHDKEIIFTFQRNLPIFEEAVVNAFKYELFLNPQYQEEVRNCFKKMRSDLEEAPSHFHESNDLELYSLKPTEPTFSY